METQNKIKVEIWSDVVCPYCYIGKRRFEKALEQFPGRENIEIEWKSFQLNPDVKSNPAININQYLCEVKGWSIDYAKQLHEQLVVAARNEGLHYDFDQTVVANTFEAHRLIQFAKAKGKGDAMEERLFKAYFSEGKNIADHSTLLPLAVETGLVETEVKEMLDSQDYKEAVQNDIYESRQIGVSGVPFFVFNRKYAVVGAQPPEAFLKTFNKLLEEAGKEG